MEKDLENQAHYLAKARVAAELLRSAPRESLGDYVEVGNLLAAFRELDNSKVFQEIDEYTGYEPAIETLERMAERRLPRRDPAEWGDLTGYSAVEPAGHGS